jgi:hypothetical protein
VEELPDHLLYCPVQFLGKFTAAPDTHSNQVMNQTHLLRNAQRGLYHRKEVCPKVFPSRERNSSLCLRIKKNL